MDELKKKAITSSNSEDAYLNKIDALEKQSVVFREEALKLFDKVAEKDKTIEALNIKMQEISNDNKFLENRVRVLTKKNKELG